MTVKAANTKMLSDLVKRMKNREQEPLRPLIDEYIIKRDKPGTPRYDGHDINMKPRPRPPGRFSPSSLYSCKRAAVFKFVGISGTRTTNPDQELLFEDGNWRHHKWQFIFYDMQEVLGRDRFKVLGIEMDVMIPDLYVAGSLDVLIAIKMPNGKWRKYVIDIKGINDRGFQWIQVKDEPKEDHVRQIQAYMKAKKVKRGILLYDSKDKNLTKTWVVDFKGEQWDETLEWLGSVQDSLNRKRLPHMHSECTVGSFMYDHCMFTKLCYGRMDSIDLQEMTYKRFKSIDKQWRKGLQLAS